MSSEIVINIAKPFKPLFEFNHRFALVKSGRAGGKSTVAGQLITALSTAFPKRDVVVTRDSFADLRDSSYEEIQSWIEEYGLGSEFIAKKSPLRIYNKRTGGNIYFMGIGGSDKHRTKSFKPKNTLIAVLFEELQQVKDQESLEQAHSSFRRFLDVEKGIFIHLYNPEPQNAHWVNVLWNIKKQDKDWLCIETTYMDVAQFLNDIDLKEIIKLKRLDFPKYEWLYLGKTGGGFGSVYPQFKRNKHFITLSQAKEKFGNMKFVAMIIGGDGAVTHDSTVFTPIGILQNGQGLVLDIFHHDPKISGQKASSELIPFIKIWFAELYAKYNLQDLPIPILWKIDEAAPELVRNLQYNFSNNRNIIAPHHKSTILEMVGVVQSAIAKNMIYVIDFGGYKDYVLNRWVNAENPLVVCLENLIWNEKQTGYDPIVPNDDSDAFTYAVNTFYKNPDNLYWLDNLIRTRKDFYDLEIERVM
jgi:PBSX family phage terminase large subunit